MSDAIGDRCAIVLPSGRELSLVAPDAALITLSDVARGLAGIYRWGGIGENRLTVAEHSIQASQAALHRRLDAGTAMAALLHDAAVQIETVGHGDKSEEYPVVHFQEPDTKSLVLKATTWNVLEAAFGEDSDLWTGKLIEVYRDPGVEFGGKVVGGVRVRIPSAAAAPKPEPLTLKDAYAQAEAVGMSKEAFIAALKEKGLTGYNPVKDAATARDIISAEAAKLDNTIPF